MKESNSFLSFSIRQVVRRYQVPPYSKKKLKWLKSLLERIS